MTGFTRKKLKDLGLKITKARTAVIDILKVADKPLDIAAIEKHIKQKKLRVNQATVYRIVDVLHKKGLIERLDFHEGKFRYEIVDKPHHHLICQKCDNIMQVVDCPVDNIIAHIEGKFNYRINSHTLEFFGLCPKCK